MVYHGPSRACETCKQRRKKCDETRPYCNRCKTSDRLCLGYKSDTDIIFRNYGPAELTDSAKSFFKSKVEIRPYGSVSPPHLSTLNGLDDTEIERIALPVFYDDYCIKSADPTVSRGFLHGLDSLITYAGPTSNLANTARLVALAGLANRLQRLSLVRKTEEAYGAVLSAYLNQLSSASASQNVELLITAVLLGLYEIITSRGDSLYQHEAHVQGIGLMINLPQSPFHMLGAIQLLQLGNPLLLNQTVTHSQVPGVVCSPMIHSSVQSLDALFLKMNPLYQRFNAIYYGPNPACPEIEALEQQFTALSLEFAMWPLAQKGEWLPRSIGRVSQEMASASPDGHFWPGNIDIYFDLYVASVWNTYRKCYVKLLYLIVECRKFLTGSEDSARREIEEAHRLDHEIIASVPYHLVKGLDEFMLQDASKIRTAEWAKPVGGLLLLHPLYTVARLPTTITAEMQGYMEDRLRWIGRNMGIGQATAVADKNTTVSYQKFGEGHVLVWAAMMMHIG